MWDLLAPHFHCHLLSSMALSTLPCRVLGTIAIKSASLAQFPWFIPAPHPGLHVCCACCSVPRAQHRVCTWKAFRKWMAHACCWMAHACCWALMKVPFGVVFTWCSAVWRGMCSGFQFPYAHHFGTHQLKKEVVILGHLCPSEESTSEAELTSIRVRVPDFGTPLFPRMLF